MWLAAISAFNLVCSGTVITISSEGSSNKQYSITYRVDLEESKWCDGECREIRDIAKIQPDTISFEDKETDSPDRNTEILNTVDRETGAHTLFLKSKIHGLSDGIAVVQYEGNCKRADFSGFPALRTQF